MQTAEGQKVSEGGTGHGCEREGVGLRPKGSGKAKKDLDPGVSSAPQAAV